MQFLPDRSKIGKLWPTLALLRASCRPVNDFPEEIPPSVHRIAACGEPVFPQTCRTCQPDETRHAPLGGGLDGLDTPFYDARASSPYETRPNSMMHTTLSLDLLLTLPPAGRS